MRLAFLPATGARRIRLRQPSWVFRSSVSDDSATGSRYRLSTRFRLPHSGYRRCMRIEDEDAEIRVELGQSLLLMAMVVVIVGIGLMFGVVL